MFAEIGSYEAKTKLPELLRAVSQGERFTITLRGEPVADLIPSGELGRGNTRQAVEAIKAFTLSTEVADEELRAFREQGRR